MKKCLGYEVSYTPWKYKIISYIQVHLVAVRVLKRRPLADSVIVAPLADVFLQFHESLPRLQIVILVERFVARLAFSNVMPCRTL